MKHHCSKYQAPETLHRATASREADWVSQYGGVMSCEFLEDSLYLTPQQHGISQRSGFPD